MAILDRIVADVRARLEPFRNEQARAAMRERAARYTPKSFERALRGRDRLSVIAEVKRASPSDPTLAPELDPAAQAAAYSKAGAAAVSVLTERDHFKGSPEDIAAVRAEISLPILRKDFVIDMFQIVEARAMGADAVLLIARILDDRALKAMLAECAAQSLSALVEVHDAAELDRALACGAKIIGVNNRNLDSLEIDLSLCNRLLPRVPPSCVAVAESGYQTRADLARIAGQADAVLIGTAFLKDPALISSLIR